MAAKRPTISLIVAMGKDGVIGLDNRLPWRLPADLAHFKSITMGKPIVMGRKTWESLPGVLPGRRHIVITRDESYQADSCTLVHSIDEAIEAAGDVDEVMIVGGSTIYREFLPLADRFYLTRVEAEIEGDAYFPQVDWDQWRELSRESHQPDEKNPHAYSFIELERVKG